MKSWVAPLAGLTPVPVIAIVGARLVRSVPNDRVSAMLVPVMVASVSRRVNWVMSFALLGATLTVTVYVLVV